MTRTILITAALAILAALALFAHAVRTSPGPATSAGRVEPRHVTPRIVAPAGIETVEHASDRDGMPELPAPAVDTLATMPASAPVRPATIDAPKVPVAP